MNDIETGWLSPSGEFIPCEIYEHYSVAHELVSKIPSSKINNPYINPDDYLYYHGWVKITRGTLFEYSLVIVWDKILTDSQKNFLKPIFENAKDIISISSIIRWEKECDGR